MSGQLDNHTAVILDSGGPHSIAMALKLMKNGFQPVILLNSSLAEQRYKVQDLATLLYFSEVAKQLKVEGKIRADMPPAFIMDTHRVNAYRQDELPDVEQLSSLAIRKVVYLNEGDRNGKIDPLDQFQSSDRLNKDLKPIVAKWEGKIKILYTGIKPWPSRDNIPYEY